MAIALLWGPEQHRYPLVLLVFVVRRHVSQTLNQPAISNRFHREIMSDFRILNSRKSLISFKEFDKGVALFLSLFVELKCCLFLFVVKAFKFDAVG